MRTLIFHVDGQRISRDERCDFENIARGTDNYLCLSFVFDSGWIGKNKVISLRDVDGVEHNYRLVQNKCVVEGAVTFGSVFSFVVYGYDGKKKETVSTERQYIHQV